jgi:hypothetical protein
LKEKNQEKIEACFSLKRMEKALSEKEKAVKIPQGLKREELRNFILSQK